MLRYARIAHYIIAFAFFIFFIYLLTKNKKKTDTKNIQSYFTKYIHN